MRGCDYHSCHRGSASHPPRQPCPHHQSLGQLRLRGQMGAGEEVTTRLRVKMGSPGSREHFCPWLCQAHSQGWSQGELLGSLLTWQLAPGASGQSYPLGPHCPTPPGREVEPQGLTGQVCPVDPPSALHRLGTPGDRICMQVMCRCALGVYEETGVQASVCTLMPMCTGHVPAWPATGVNSRVRRGYLCVEGWEGMHVGHLMETQARSPACMLTC